MSVLGRPPEVTAPARDYESRRGSDDPGTAAPTGRVRGLPLLGRDSKKGPTKQPRSRSCDGRSAREYTVRAQAPCAWERITACRTTRASRSTDHPGLSSAHSLGPEIRTLDDGSALPSLEVATSRPCRRGPCAY